MLPSCFVSNYKVILMDGKLYFVFSPVQDECTLCNRWFKSHIAAWEYFKKVYAETGCKMYLCAVDSGEE